MLISISQSSNPPKTNQQEDPWGLQTTLSENRYKSLQYGVKTQNSGSIICMVLTVNIS